jgi:hypothetical protein
MTASMLIAKDGASNESIFLGKGKGGRGLSLPSADTQRWSSRRKAAVFMAVRAAVISREEACARYTLSPEELTGWELAFEENGIPGLRITRLQIYREAWTANRRGRGRRS